MFYKTPGQATGGARRRPLTVAAFRPWPDARGFGSPGLGNKWLLMNVGGSITDQTLVVHPSAPALSPGLAYAIETDTSVPGFSSVYLAVVPEPGTAGLMILAALLLRRRARF